MSSVLQDFRYALRLLAKAPGFTVAAVVVLALGIGVNTAIFSLVDELVFSARPWPAEKQVVQLYTQNERDPKRYRMFSYAAFHALREQKGAFTDIMAHNMTIVGIGTGDTSRRAFSGLVSSNYFSTLQVPLVRGRSFSLAEEKPGSATPVVIASYNYWMQDGLREDLIGRTIRVNERPFTVIGIAPEGFSGTMSLLGPELYFPLGCYDLLNSNYGAEDRKTLDHADAYNLVLVGRLRASESLDGANASLSVLANQLRRDFPVELKEETFVAHPLPRLSTSNAPSTENSLQVMGISLLVMAGIVLLIASLNLANMLLARSTARRKEFAVRLALGGGRARILRQLLTEGLVLALAGGAAGFLLGSWSTSLLVRMVSDLAPLSLFFKGAANPALFAATFAFCALATVFFALGPALKLSRTNVLADLKEHAGEDSVRRRWRWLPRHPLVVLQLALSLGLLTSAGLFIRGAVAAGRADTGFHADDTLLIEADASLGGYDQVRASQLYRAEAEHLAAIPGVQSVSISALVPFGMVSLDRVVQRAGVHPAKDAKPATAAEGLAFNARWNSIGVDYFPTVGLALKRGRAFSPAETENAGAPAVVIIDETLAKRLWPDGDALGQRIQFADREAPRAAGDAGSSTGISSTSSALASDPPSLEIVGIAAPTRWELFSENTGGAMYVPFAQGYQANVFFHVRPVKAGAASDNDFRDTIRRDFRAVAPGLPLLSIKTFRQHLDSSMEVWIVRIGAVMFSVFGGLALALAGVGLYGVKAYAVARRTREIGIRMALGAEPAKVMGLILREGTVMILTGLGLGLLLGLGLGQLVANMLYKVSPFDPVSFVVAPCVLAAVALVACWIPARRATRISPLTALRTE